MVIISQSFFSFVCLFEVVVVLIVFFPQTTTGTPTTVLQKFALKDQMAILISFTAVSKNWKKEMEAAKKVIDSFRFF